MRAAYRVKYVWASALARTASSVVGARAASAVRTGATPCRYSWSVSGATHAAAHVTRAEERVADRPQIAGGVIDRHDRHDLDARPTQEGARPLPDPAGASA
jgi:hypothetical protein